MNGLWKKETNENGSCYIDIFQFNGLPLDSQRLTAGNQFIDKRSKKDDEFSTKLRNLGNFQFERQQWRLAMEMYSQSLRYAPDGSRNISLAYANRSSCFLRMKMYEQCLIDIALAVEANYPKDLMRKLNDRKAICLDQMQKSTEPETATVPMLSYSGDDKFPCLANVLELRCNDEFGKHIVAESDINVGEIVILEELFTIGARINDRVFCSTCFKFKRNFIPCRSCLCVFCDAHCLESNEIHKIDCGALYHSTLRVDDISIVKSILIGVKAFSTVDDLMEFVVGALASRDFNALDGLANNQLKYGQFLKLLPVPKCMSPDLITQYAMIHQFLHEIPEIQRRFNSKSKARFLMHLLWHHILIIKSNTFSIRISDVGIINTVGNFTALLNHSCSPNVCVTLFGNQQMAITIRPVKKGEQLFTEYKGVDKKEFLFACKCSKCVPRYKHEDCKRMRLDPLFDFILRSDQTYFLEDTKFPTLKSKCQEFLTKYGHLPWSNEIELVAEKYENCLDHVYLKC